jgi:hypothetical protein
MKIPEYFKPRLPPNSTLALVMSGSSVATLLFGYWILRAAPALRIWSSVFLWFVAGICGVLGFFWGIRAMCSGRWALSSISILLCLAGIFGSWLFLSGLAKAYVALGS